MSKFSSMAMMMVGVCVVVGGALLVSTIAYNYSTTIGYGREALHFDDLRVNAEFAVEGDSLIVINASSFDWAEARVSVTIAGERHPYTATLAHTPIGTQVRLGFDAFAQSSGRTFAEGKIVGVRCYVVHETGNHVPDPFVALPGE